MIQRLLLSALPLLLVFLTACGDPGTGRPQGPGCTPACGEAMCGGDGCGGSCGTCGADQSCASGVCVSGCINECSAGETICDSAGVRTCSAESGCAKFSAPVACGTGLVCSGGMCTDTCADQCTLGETKCSLERVQNCVTTAAGCTDWGPPEGCAVGVCQAGQCGTTCTDMCTAGARRCVSESTEEVCEVAGGGCLGWVPRACGQTAFCEADQCVPLRCEPECPAGLTCDAGTCTGPLTNIVLNEVGYSVSGTLRVNGAVPTRDAIYCGEAWRADQSLARVRFIDESKGYNASHYVTCGDGNFDFSTTLPPGTYRVLVSRSSYSDEAGVNLLAVDYVADEALVVSAPVAGLVFDEIGHPVSGTLRVNGAVPTRDAIYCGEAWRADQSLARVRFIDESKGYNASHYVTCGDGNFDFSTTLPPGTYRVLVSRSSYSDEAGVNLLAVDYVADEALVVSAPVAGLVFDEIGHPVSGTLRVNGAVPARDAIYCGEAWRADQSLARVRFIDESKGYNASHYVTCGDGNFDFSTTLPPGTYRVLVSRSSYSDEAGVNLLAVDYVADEALVVSAPVSGLVFDEIGHPVSGTLGVNGAAPTRDATYCGEAWRADQSLARVRFIDESKGYNASHYVTCGDGNFDFTTTLPPGTYRVLVSRSSYSDEAGVNLLAVDYVADEALVVSAPLSGLVFDEIGYSVGGTLGVNGAAPTRDATYCGEAWRADQSIARVRFIDESKGYNASHYVTCGDAGFDFTTTLPPGTYRVLVSRSSYSDEAGVNLLGVDYVMDEALVVSAPVSGLWLDELGHMVSGSLRVNGAAPTRDATYCGEAWRADQSIARVRFIDESKGYNASHYITCGDGGFDFSTLLPPGTFRVLVSRSSYSDEANVNLLGVDYVAINRLRVP